MVLGAPTSLGPSSDVMPLQMGLVEAAAVSTLAATHEPWPNEPEGGPSVRG